MDVVPELCRWMERHFPRDGGGGGGGKINVFSKLGSDWDEVYPLSECLGSCMTGESVVMIVAATSCVVPIPVGSHGDMR